MVEKVKVSHEVAEAIEDRKRISRYTFKDFMKAAVSQQQFSTSASALNSLSVERLAEILINGYEIEVTPEEKILDKFNRMKHIDWDMYTDGMTFVLDVLDIKINGINE